ncbi:MAG: hypothetical protein ABFD64_07035 [Armatimonadota bacterium]
MQSDENSTPEYTPKYQRLSPEAVSRVLKELREHIEQYPDEFPYAELQESKQDESAPE